MTDKIILISDFIDDFVGGAALNDEEIYNTLKKHYDVQKIKKVGICIRGSFKRTSILFL